MPYYNANIWHSIQRRFTLGNSHTVYLESNPDVYEAMLNELILARGDEETIEKNFSFDDPQ